MKKRVKQSLEHSDNLVADPLLLSGNKEGSAKSVDSIVIEKLETSSMFHEQVAVASVNSSIENGLL